MSSSSAGSEVRQKPSGMRIFIAIFLALHIPLFVYPVVRLGGWLGLDWMIETLIVVPILFSQVISRWWLRGAIQRWLKLVRQVADFILGISPIVLINLILAEIGVASGIVQEVEAAWAVIVVSLIISSLGMFAAIRPMVKRVRLEAKFLRHPLRVVQVTDVHIGSRSIRFLENVIVQINYLAPDLLCITGDFIDAYGIQEEDLVSLRQLCCPVYFSIGNHERYEDLEEISERLSNLGVIVLRNRAVMYRDDVQIVGIDDRDDALQVERQLVHIPVAKDSFNLLMYHRPVGIEAASEAGIDLMLSGHTHNGQIFPFNLIVKSVFEKIAGLYQYNETWLYVSQGTGTWGPVMRVGTRSEITLFEIECVK